MDAVTGTGASGGSATAKAAAATAATEDSDSKKAASALSSDFTTFLKMLTVQMENQDPLNPIESSDFAVQLATFSGVEQQVRSNDLLETLTNQQSVSALAQLANWVGMEARAAVPAAFDGTTPVTYYPDPPADADQATLLVKNASGVVVSRSAVPATSDPGTWNGTDQAGASLPAGNYSLSVEYRKEGALLETRPAEVYAPVTEAQLAEDGPVVVFATGGQMSADKVSAVRAPGS